MARKNMRKALGAKNSPSKDIAELMRFVLDLKQTTRTGWARKGIAPCESVADHSYSTAVLAMLLAKRERADAGKAAQIALMHDIGEAITGDIVSEERGTVDKKAKAAKERKEQAALRRMLKGHKELFDLAMEYQAQKSKEAIIAREASRIEMVLQALRYEQQGKASALELDEFWQSAAWPLRTKSALALFGELERMRKKK